MMNTHRNIRSNFSLVSTNSNVRQLTIFVEVESESVKIVNKVTEELFPLQRKDCLFEFHQYQL